MCEAPVAIGTARALECRLEPRAWRFAEQNRARIDAHWAQLVAAKPDYFNGTVLMLHERVLEDGVFRGAYAPVHYADFIAWRDFGPPGPPRWNGFAMAALLSREGHFLLGEMAEHTANPGAIYFAAGTPDLNDVRDGAVDLARSVMRELTEETGLVAADVTIEPGWTVVEAGPRIAFMRVLRSTLSSLDLKEKIETFLAAEAKPELVRMHIVAGPDDLVADRMPEFQRAYLDHAFAQRER